MDRGLGGAQLPDDAYRNLAYVAALNHCSSFRCHTKGQWSGSLFCPVPKGWSLVPRASPQAEAANIRSERPRGVCVLLSALLALKHDPRALPQRDAGRRPARHRRPVGCLCHLEVVDAGDVLHDAVAGVVPDVHAEGEVRFGFHGQARLDSPWPGTIYTLCCYVACAPAQTARTLPLSSVTPCR